MNSYISISKEESLDKKVFFFILSLIATLFISIAAIVYVVDPFQFFHKSYFSKKFSTNQRYQTPGIIKNFPAKNYIFGTSMTENFIASEVKKELGTSDMQRLSISGVLPKNFATVLRFLLNTNNVERIVLDAHWYFESLDVNKENEQHSFPSYLYSSKWLDSLKYVFNHDNIKLSLKVLRGKEEGFSDDLEKINRWMKPSLFERFTSKESLKKIKSKLAKNKNNFNILKTLEEGKSYKYPSLDMNLIKIIKENPDVKFEIYLPPYTTWYYASSSKKKFIKRLIYMRKYLADKTSELKNVIVYGFDTEFEIVNNLENYKDYGHYHPRINKRIIKAIKLGTNILDKRNSERYLRDMISNINSYKF